MGKIRSLENEISVEESRIKNDFLQRAVEKVVLSFSLKDHEKDRISAIQLQENTIFVIRTAEKKNNKIHESII